MSKTNKSKSGSRSSRSRSGSRSRSRSFSKSRSRSRSISRSRKRRLSSRSRSRSYSPSHNRERNHPRVYQNRDFRGHNRGYRRPYYFRGRNRGFYPWGQYNRGGYGNYRSNWQNYRQAYSPRRGRSRSRSPKRRSPSPRSRSHSRNSDKSSSDRSRRSSSSRSSSNHSRVESSKRKSGKEKKSSSKDARASQAAGDNQGDESKEQQFSGAGAQDAKASEGSKPWQDVSSYGTGSTSRGSVSELSPRERSPALKSPLQSVVVRRRSPRPSPVQKPSPPRSSPSPMGSAAQSGSTSFQGGSHQSPFEHGSAGMSPTRKSPVCKSPTPVSSLYGATPKEEGTAPGGGAFSKRYLEEQKTENGKDKDQKVINAEKEKSKEKGNFSELGSTDGKTKSDSYGSKADSEKGYRGSQSPKRYKFRDDFDKLKVPEFHKEGHYGKDETDELDKKEKAKGRKDSEFDDEPKFMSKVVATSSKSQEEDRSGKWEGVVFLPPGKEKQRKPDEMEEESYSERSKKEDRSGSKRAEPGHRGFVPEKNFRVTTYKSSQEKSSSPPPRKASEVKEKPGTKVEGLTPGKSSFSITREAQVNIRMDSFDEDLARPSGILAQERKLCRDLVHSNKKEQEFRSIFHHIQSAQSQRSPSELFAQHIVTIVHHVREHHFGSSAMTLNERFTKYLKKGMEQDAAKNKKSPEIHRRIDISPSTFRKHGFSQEESKSSRDPGFKAEGKYKDDPVDLRLDIERRKKHKERDLKRDKSRESVDSRDSSHSRERSTEKTEKSHKGSKKKKHRRVRERSRSSSSSSWSSHSVKAEEYPEETEEREESSTGFDKSRLGTKEFTGPNERGRARGTFQFRARGRGWGRGNFSGNNSSNSSGNNDFQKRSREEEWDPEYTPKSKKYYLHDDREGEGTDKWVNRGRGRGAFPRGRGRFMFRKSSTSPKWAHDKFSGEEGEIEDDESGTENREEKDALQTTAE
ncbi:thyroid hormone receptor-associated protein 3 isoform X1 [Poecile atricapillus]|uniref:thyroid hormone receptor-associated protein 3 isoform X1 n=1 Tax=Poecile atricapillus TaxID=48891 RepID=UPI002738F786|nr:thyroid hormone receptor-associated protein 3 isoform X1 [Poecile atricapillus]XP_058712472.1 thyroid hormone receptor-associated protein 3 isoform X1 [Poecile atricapillus]XP_058712473.1 thyroid hormone receptor-associated protein 3 isoform X1 [Poecile atricapillus]XP_058712474.1 thyroid hormone receptor-associated protein 3 isoform X1 [Poecile atricapillus]XP_058712475.1 thyroid hormone receptor-associated protein 3 isoform X1 [Poecile atricapillus]XP_058712476.1 thyroid hormone receptor-